MIFFQIRYCPYLCPFRISVRTISFFSQITSHSPGSMSGDVIIETNSQRISSRSIQRAKMRLTYHHGCISVFTKQFRQTFSIKSVRYTFLRAQAIIIPITECQQIVLPVCRNIFLQGPVSHPVPCCISSGEKAHP